MRISECFEHDVMVRAAWVGLVDEADRGLFSKVDQPARSELYNDIDAMVKEKFLENIRKLNEKQHVIHVKGFGSIRQADEQYPIDMIVSGAASDVMAELNLVEFTKPAPIPTPDIEDVESDTE